MQAIRTHVAGVDVHKEILAITILIGAADEKPEVFQFSAETFTEDLMAVGRKFLDMGVTEVAMESTGVFWKPLYNVWSPMGINITVGQAGHMKNVPGRKTDMSDSHWIAELHRCGLIRPSLIPEDEYQRMRLLSRHRTNLVKDRDRVKNRIQKTLEDGNVKLGTIASDVFGKSGLQVLRTIAEDCTDASVLSSKVTTKIKRKEEARKALTNCLTTEHIFLIQELMEQFDHLEARIKNAESELRDKIEPYKDIVAALDEIPGIDEILAMGIIAEATTDMSNFPNERNFAAWAGVAAGNNESAGKKKDQNVEKATRTSENC
jgi:transposase